MLFFRLADEEDGVPLAGPDTGECGAEGLPVFTPCDLRPGLSLNKTSWEIVSCLT